MSEIWPCFDLLASTKCVRVGCYTRLSSNTILTATRLTPHVHFNLPSALYYINNSQGHRRRYRCWHRGRCSLLHGAGRRHRHCPGSRLGLRPAPRHLPLPLHHPASGGQDRRGRAANGHLPRGVPQEVRIKRQKSRRKGTCLLGGHGAKEKEKEGRGVGWWVR